MGPRAPGNRSILAAPFDASTTDRLNRIKRREPFRPIAPIVLEEDASRHFDLPFASPHMLYFARVRSRELKAVTHVDDSARPQAASRADHPGMYALLEAFKA